LFANPDGHCAVIADADQVQQTVVLKVGGQASDCYEVSVFCQFLGLVGRDACCFIFWKIHFRCSFDCLSKILYRSEGLETYPPAFKVVLSPSKNGSRSLYSLRHQAITCSAAWRYSVGQQARKNMVV
jgi:hypothetical protein